MTATNAALVPSELQASGVEPGSKVRCSTHIACWDVMCLSCQLSDCCVLVYAATADSAESEAMQLVVKTAASGSPTSHSAKPVVTQEPATGRAKLSAPQTTLKLPKAPSSPGKAGSKRKTCKA